MWNERKVRRALLVLAVVALAAVVLLACNSSTDDPDESQNLVKITAFEPTEACVDVDGDDEGVVHNVLVTVDFESTVRGGEGSAFDDATLTDVTICYDMDDGRHRCDHRTVTVTVPANGTTEYPLTVVKAEDVGTYFQLGDEGTITLTFSGKDLGDHPVHVAPRGLPVFTANECEQSGGGGGGGA